MIENLSREPLRTARELMIPLDSYPHVADTAVLADAIAALAGAQILRRGSVSLPRIVLVFDGDEQLLGLVRRRDILRGLLPDFLTRPKDRHAEAQFDFDEAVDLDLTDLFVDEGAALLEKNSATSVLDVLQPIAAPVPPDAGLMDLIKEMVQNEFHIVPVVEGEQVIGVVRTVEVMNQVRRLLGIYV